MSFVCVFNTSSNLIDTVEGATSFTGSGAAGTPVVLNSSGVIDSTLLALGATAVAGENIQTGALVNLYNNGSFLYIQLAYAAATGVSPAGPSYPVLASGFVPNAILSGQSGTISFSGLFIYTDTHSEFTAASIGSEVFLSAIDKGGITLTRPSGVGQAAQAVGYVLAYNSGTHQVTVEFIAGFKDFTQISGVAQITQGGTGATTTTEIIHNVFGQPIINQVFAGAASGSVADPTFRYLVQADLVNAVFHASGGSHSVGAVPDPGSSAGTTRFLREDSTWDLPVTPIINSDNPGQVASIGPVTLITPSSAGTFRISIYEECTVVGATGGGSPFGYGVFGSGVLNMLDDSVQTSVSWTDDSGVRNTTPISLPLDLGKTNAASGDVFIRSAAGQPITFTSALAATGTPTYGVFVRLETL